MHRTKAAEQIPSYDASIDELKKIARGMTDVGSGILQRVLDVPFASWTDEMNYLIHLLRFCRIGADVRMHFGEALEGPRTHWPYRGPGQSPVQDLSRYP